MPPLTLTVSLAIAALGVAAALWVNLRSPERLATHTARRVGLTLPAPPLLDEITRRARHTRRWIANCGVVGLLLTLGVTLATVAAGHIRDLVGLTWLALGGIVLGAAVGALLGVLTHRPHLDPERPRVAHAQHTSLRDYLDPIELDGARIVTGLAVVTGIATALVLLFAPDRNTAIAESTTTPAALVLPVVALVSILVLEVGGRRIVLARPRPAATPEALIWDDAQRADDLRTLATAPIMTGSYGFILGVPSLYSAVPPLGVGEVALLVLVNVGFCLLFVGVLVVLAFVIARKPAQFYLRRLWPEVAAREEEQLLAVSRAYYEAELQKAQARSRNRNRAPR